MSRQNVFAAILLIWSLKAGLSFSGFVFSVIVDRAEDDNDL